MSRASCSLLVLLVLTIVGGRASAAPKPPTREQMFYARREVELESQLAKMKMKYTDTNPNVVELQKEMAFCKQRTTPLALSKARHGGQPVIATLEQELIRKQDELYHLQLRMSDANPLVKATQKDVDDLKREIALRKNH